MEKAFAVVAVFAALQLGGASRRDPSNWSGGWTSRGDRDVEIVSIRPGSGSARGWNGFVEALLATRAYRIDISHTVDRVAIAFPGGSSNMLTLPETPLDTEPSIRVVDHGEWWTKYVSSARIAEGVVEVAATTFSGWWREGGPDRAKPKATDYRRHYTLAPGSHPDQLALRVHLSDEKGEVEYLQTFRREALFPSSADAQPTPKEQVAAATLTWGNTLGRNDPDQVVPLYAPDAVLWGTLSPTIRAERAALREYFVTAFKTLPSLKVTFGEQLIRIYGNTAVNTGNYTFSYIRDGQAATLPARYSFTFVKEGERWMIVDHHSSAMPSVPR
jgi:uncharacterized protein (TIGR02246 family)